MQDASMLTKTSILKLLRANSGLMHERFSVRRLGLFGSHARDEASPDSDIDLLVEFETPTFDHYMDLKFFLEDLFETDVELVMADTVKPRLKPYISQEVIYA